MSCHPTSCPTDSLFRCPRCGEHMLVCIYLNKIDQHVDSCRGCVALNQFGDMTPTLKGQVIYQAKALYLNCLNLALGSIQSEDPPIIINSLKQVTDFSNHMMQVVQMVDQVALIISRHGQLFGGFLRDWLIRYTNRIALPVELQRPILNQHLQLQDLSNIALSFREPIEPLIQEDFKDIDVWVQTKDDWYKIRADLQQAGFSIANVFSGHEIDHDHEPVVSCPEFQLGQVRVVHDGIALFLDVVCSNELPVNDFACNTLTARIVDLDGLGQRTIQWTAQPIGHSC